MRINSDLSDRLAMKPQSEIMQAFKDMISLTMTHELTDAVHAAQYRGAVVALGWVLGEKHGGCEAKFCEELLRVRATLSTHKATEAAGL